MKSRSVSVAGVASSNPIAIDEANFAKKIGLYVSVPDTATATYTVEQSGEDVRKLPSLWAPHGYLAAMSAGACAILAPPAGWVRLNVTAYSGSGNITLTVNEEEE